MKVTWLNRRNETLLIEGESRHAERNARERASWRDVPTALPRAIAKEKTCALTAAGDKDRK